MLRPLFPIQRLMKRPSLSVSRGFTLVEMLVVITIIVILAAMLLGGLQFVKDKQAREKTKVQVQLLCKSIEDYKLDNGYYPSDPSDPSHPTPPNPDGSKNSNVLYKALYWDTNNDGKGADTDTVQKIYCAELDPLQKKQGWTQGTGANATIIDPWFNEYRYRIGTTSWNPDYDLWSAGKDGKTNASAPKRLDAFENKDDIGNF